MIDLSQDDLVEAIYQGKLDMLRSVYKKAQQKYNDYRELCSTETRQAIQEYLGDKAEITTEQTGHKSLSITGMPHVRFSIRLSGSQKIHADRLFKIQCETDEAVNEYYANPSKIRRTIAESFLTDKGKALLSEVIDSPLTKKERVAHGSC